MLNKGWTLKTIHRYVLKEMMPSFLLCAGMLTFLFMINKVFLMLDMVLNKNVPLLETLLLYASILPFVLSLTLPMSVMVGTLLAFGRMSSDMEVTAFKSSGGHLFHLIGPVLVFGLLMTGGMVYFDDKILPAANFASKKIQFNILRKQANVAIRERVFINQFEGYQFYIDRQNSGGLFSDVKVFNRWAPRAPVQTTLAKTGNLVTNQDSYQVFFHLNSGVMTWDNDNYHTYNRLYFDSYIIRLKLENQLARMTDIKKDYEEMDLTELKEGIATEKDPGRLNWLKTEFQERLALPFACLVLAWFCAPLGLWTKSRGFMGFVLGLGMIFVYYLMFNLGRILSAQGSVSPILGLWSANAILTLSGCLIYYLVVSEHSAFKLIWKIKTSGSRKSEKGKKS